MDLSYATGKIPATPGIDPGTFRLVAHFVILALNTTVAMLQYLKKNKENVCLPCTVKAIGLESIYFSVLISLYR